MGKHLKFKEDRFRRKLLKGKKGRKKIIAVFTKDGAGSHHGHTLEYSELKVPSEISQDPLSVRL